MECSDPLIDSDYFLRPTRLGAAMIAERKRVERIQKEAREFELLVRKSREIDDKNLNIKGKYQ